MITIRLPEHNFDYFIQILFFLIYLLYTTEISRTQKKSTYLSGLIYFLLSRVAVGRLVYIRLSARLFGSPNYNIYVCLPFTYNRCGISILYFGVYRTIHVFLSTTESLCFILKFTNAQSPFECEWPQNTATELWFQGKANWQETGSLK